MSEPALRPARPADLPALVGLCADHAAYERAEYDPEGKAERLGGLLFGPGSWLRAVVAEHDGALVGYATWSAEVSTWDAVRYGRLDCLYLAPEARGHGTGRRLVSHVARAARAAGCDHLQWQTPTFNVGAVRFYGRLGATAKDKVRFVLSGPAMADLARTPDAP